MAGLLSRDIRESDIDVAEKEVVGRKFLDGCSEIILRHGCGEVGGENAESRKADPDGSFENEMPFYHLASAKVEHDENSVTTASIIIGRRLDGLCLEKRVRMGHV